MSRIGKIIAIVLGVLVLSAPPRLYAQDRGNPNIIFILADDLGYGDLSCYGQKHFQTPNIDRLAAEGIRFTNHYSGSTVCAPSRSAMMTGMHTGHTYIRGNKEVEPEGQWPLPGEAFTLTEMMKGAGYTTGVFGKWGLGYPGSEGAPENQGVDRFFGYNCQRLAHNYYPAHLWDDDKKIILEGNTGSSKEQYAPELIHEQAMKFLETNKDRPFFLFYPMIIPHAELVAPEQYLAKYRGKYLPEKSFDGIDAGELKFRSGPYGSQPETHAAFAAMIHIMDEQVGSIVDKVRYLGLSENTLIIFSSDNGPHVEGGADPDYFDSNGILRGYKRDLYEGGIRVPMIVRWKGTIEPGRESNHISAFWDILPTFAQLLKLKVPDKVDGVSFLPTLLNKGKQKQHDRLYWEYYGFGGRRALRQGDWKLVQYGIAKNLPESFELYNLATDPSEQRNVASKYPDRLKDLKAVMLAEHLPSSVFKFGNAKE